MGIIERINMFRDYLRIGQTAFEVNVGVAKGYFSKVKTLGSDKVVSIHERYPQLNIEWLITGEGDMIVSDEYTRHQKENSKSDIPHYEEIADKENSRQIDNSTIEELKAEIVALKAENSVLREIAGLGVKKESKSA